MFEGGCWKGLEARLIVRESGAVVPHSKTWRRVGRAFAKGGAGSLVAVWLVGAIEGHQFFVPVGDFLVAGGESKVMRFLRGLDG